MPPGGSGSGWGGLRRTGDGRSAMPDLFRFCTYGSSSHRNALIAEPY